MQHPHTNQLIHETSPYLLQHAHNPVNWYPWGEEALQKSIEEDKPILVSIGYSACHWCHVMERESFEDEATAELMNRYFINIKIDREERPDLDHIYMDAVQAMTGSGGWPLNVFLTPERKPFFGGTYFPPVRAYNRASWKEILTGVHKGYQEKKNEIISQAENLTEHLSAANAFGNQSADEQEQEKLFSAASLAEIASNILKNADTEWGGFGNAPKFPQTFSIQFLLRHHHIMKDPASLAQALLSLDKMIAGGIYDQLGGGFARYSTDIRWQAPHFEKMLYDNALLIGVLAEAYQLTGIDEYKKVISQTINFIDRELTSTELGLFSALDADSEGIEGKFYTWEKQEIDDLLGTDAAIFSDYYQVTAAGNWEHTNILWRTTNLQEFAKKNGLSNEEWAAMLEKCHKKLLETRFKRPRPLLDDKILLGWNALMNTAFSKSYSATGEEKLREKAILHMDFMEARMENTAGGWWDTYKNGEAIIAAFLDDYAYLIQAYIHLQEITGQAAYLIKARQLAKWVITHFVEPATGFFFYTHAAQTDVVIRKKEVYDGAVPSGNAVMAGNLIYLGKIFDIPQWQAHGHDMISSLGKAIIKHPTSFGVWAMNLQNRVIPSVEIVLVGQQAGKFLGQVLRKYIPNKIIQVAETNSSFFPLLNGKLVSENAENVDYYLCRDYACSKPFTKIDMLLANV